MRKLKFLLFSLALSNILVPADSQISSAEVTSKTSGFVIPFVLINNKTILTARIGDSRMIRIVLDSGLGWDGMVITNTDLVDSIDLRFPMEASLSGAGNSGESTAVFSDSMTFTIGSKEFKDQRIVILRRGGSGVPPLTA
jgi:hypothetical protein